MKIDEQKEIEIFKVERQGIKQCNKSIFRSQCYNVKYRLHQQNRNKKQEKNYYKKGNQKHKKLIKRETLQESYNKWTEEVRDVIKEVEKTVRKNSRKDVRELQEIRKNLRITKRNTKGACERRILKDRIILLKEHIMDKIKEWRSNRIKRIAESITNNTNNGRKIWQVKRRVKKKG